jgi:hypothetical protein
VAFAVAADVAARLGRSLTVGETSQVTALLDDATGALQDAIGWQVYPPVTATITQRVEGGQWLELPPATTAVSSVSIKTDPVVAAAQYGSWELVDGGLFRLVGWPVGTATIICTFGYAAVPSALKRWAIVLAMQAFDAITKTGSPGGSGTTSVAIDDFRQGWDAAAATAAPMTVPERQAEQLRASFGLGSAFVTGSRT